MFNLYSKYFSEEAHEGFRDFNMRGQVIRMVECADYLVILAKEILCMIDRLSEIGRCGGMEMNVKKIR